MATVNAYLTFNGNCEEAFNFYKSVLGGLYPMICRFSEMPPDACLPIAPEDADKIMHASLPISKETILTGSDTGGEWGMNYKQGNNFSISITAENNQVADRYFKGLSEGGKVTMPMDSTFWGDYFSMFTDKFGINWMVSYDEGCQNG